MPGTRKQARDFNQVQLSKWRGSDVYTILRDAHERLEATDPDYRMSYVTFIDRDGIIELDIQYTPSRHVTDQDRVIMDAICINAEQEAQQHYGR